MNVRDSVEQVRAFIDKQRNRRQSNKVLHGHPSPLFWQDEQIRIPDVLETWRDANAHIRKRVNVYVATPYCLPTNPDRCGFCLFPSEVYQGASQLETYLRYLKREGEMYREHLEGSEIASVYFGGGTSNLYKADTYPRLVELVRSILPQIGSGTEITLEGIPQLFTYEKLAAMKSAGVTRVSMGVQQLDDELIKLSGRKQTRKHVFQALGWCRELGLDTSVDLIFGWPTQTIADMLRDLRAVTDVGVRHITHYELNVAGRSDFARNHRDTLPSIEANLEMYRLGREFLLSRGFKQATAYDWEKPRDEAVPEDAGLSLRPGKYLYEENMRGLVQEDDSGRVIGNTIWGWGFAGISYWWGTSENPGAASLNASHVKEYYAALDQGRFPVERGFHYGREDLHLTCLFQSLQGMTIDTDLYAKAMGFHVREDFAAVWQVLAELGWADVKSNRIDLIGDGVFFTPLVQSLLASERVTALRQRGQVSERPSGLVPLRLSARSPAFEAGHP